MTTKEYFDFVDSLWAKRREGIDGFMLGAAGMSGESGEVLDEVKKCWQYGKEMNREKMIEELADTLHYMTQLCIKLGITFEDLVANNTTKLMKRFPNGYTDAAAINRADQNRLPADTMWGDYSVLDEPSVQGFLGK